MNKYLFTVSFSDGMTLQYIIIGDNKYEAEQILREEFEPMYNDAKITLIDIEEGKKDDTSL